MEGIPPERIPPLVIFRFCSVACQKDTVYVLEDGNLSLDNTDSSEQICRKFVKGGKEVLDSLLLPLHPLIILADFCIGYHLVNTLLLTALKY